jgi:glycosyltransferase involved in cell wall biosynthesis
MRVLHVIPGVAARYGGPSRAIFEMCRALQEQEVEPLIATTNADGPARLPVDLARPVMYQGVPVIFFSRQWSEGFKYSRPLACWLQANVKRFDLVHIDAVFSHASLAAARACWRHHVPFVVRPLGSLAPWSISQKRFRKRLLWHFGVQQMLRRAAVVHYASAEERRQAEWDSGLQRGVVIPLGVDQEALNPPVAPEPFRQRYPDLSQDPYVLVLCRLHPVKGLELFLELFLQVTRKAALQRWQLVVAGDGEAGYVGNLKRLVRRQGGDRRVLFTGWLDGPEKVAALQEAALLALPSHHENFGLAAMEALACGIPVLVSTHVNLAHEIRTARAGWVVNLRRPELLQALEAALRQEAERTARGRAGQDLVRCRFQWANVVAQLTQLYGSIVRSHGSPSHDTLSSRCTDV